MSGNKKLFLVDGSALLYRSFFAFIKNPLINSKGVNTSAVYGFTTALLKIFKEENPHMIAVVFDSPEPTFRHKRYPLYKATREKMPDELIQQLPVVESIIEAFNIPLIRKPSVEADDIIATLAVTAEKSGYTTYIVTADKDLFQIVSDKIGVYNLRGKEKNEDRYIDPEGVKKKLGVPPERVIDYLSLVGDASDNVPGVEGVGEKTAIRLLEEYRSVDGLIADIDTVSPEGLQKKIRAGMQDLLLSRELVTLQTDIPLPLDAEAFKVLPWNRAMLTRLFHDLEFISLLKDIAPSAREELASYTIVKSAGDLPAELKQSKLISFDITALQAQAGPHIFGISFSCEEKKAFFLDFSSNENKKLIQAAREMLEDRTSQKICHDAKRHLNLARDLGMKIENVCFDTMLAAFLIAPSLREPDISVISLDYLNFDKDSFEKMRGRHQEKIDPYELSEEEISKVSCENADVALRLYPVLRNKIQEESMADLFYKIEMPLTDILFRMEQKGVKLDISVLHLISAEIEKTVEKLEKDIFSETGMTFNLSSPKQLGNVLFEKVNIQSLVPHSKVKKSKTGYSTSVEALSMYKGLPLVEKILEHRSLSKLKNTYIDTLPGLCDAASCRLHTEFHQAITQTGRLSSTNPNLQNIPIRSEVGEKIRAAFVAEKGYSLVSADYSQIELRILAHLTQDDMMLEAFTKDKDIHTQTASLIFHMPEKDVTPAYRSRAKAINFGIVYGMGPRKLSMETGITFSEANSFINEYFRAHPKVKAFIDEQISRTRETQMTRTLLGRIRHVPELSSSNPALRAAGENIAVNTPIQGSSADIIKIAMINVDRELSRELPEASMILQIHDELVFEVPDGKIEEASKIIRKEMCSAFPLSVPVLVHIKSGKSWLEC